MNDEELIVGIRAVVKEYGGLTADADTVAPDADLYAAGMTSFASVEVMLGLEEKLGITFPQDMIGRETFLSLAAMASAVAEISSRS
jgi:acyl carrier protein